jgi:hypothetical protein
MCFVRISEVTAIMSLSGANRGFVGPKAYTIWGALFKKKNTNLRIQDKVRKWMFVCKEKRNHKQLQILKKADQHRNRYKIEKNIFFIY